MVLFSYFTPLRSSAVFRFDWIYFYILIYINIYSFAKKDNRVPKIFLSGKVEWTALSGPGAHSLRVLSV